MPPLDDPRHEAFARLLAKNVPQHDAWVEVGYSAKEAKPGRGAGMLARRSYIKARVAELQQFAGKRNKRRDVASLLASLDRAQDIAEDKNSAADIIAATMAQAKLLGLLTDRLEVGGPGDFSRLRDIEAIIEAVRDQIGGEDGIKAAEMLAALTGEPVVIINQPVSLAAPKPNVNDTGQA